MDFSYISVKHNVKLLTKMNPTLLEKAKNESYIVIEGKMC